MMDELKVIKNFQYEGDLKDTDGKYHIPNWAIEAYEKHIIFYKNGELYVRTNIEPEHVNIGDYIFKGMNGDIFPIVKETMDELGVTVNEKL